MTQRNVEPCGRKSRQLLLPPRVRSPEAQEPEQGTARRGIDKTRAPSSHPLCFVARFCLAGCLQHTACGSKRLPLADLPPFPVALPPTLPTHPPNPTSKPQPQLQFNGQHPLRERARRLDEGILVIRFEMPFNVFCCQCGEHVAKGERFNADKKQAGSYYSTKIWSFTMRHHCGCKIVITTDPKNAEYVISEGARRKEEGWDAAETGTLVIDTEQAARLAADPLARLEAGEARKASAAQAAAGLADLAEAQELRYADDYGTNKALRGALRGAKKADAALDTERAALGLADGVRLLPASDDDREAAAVAFVANDDRFQRNHAAARRDILQQSIFSAAASATTVTAARAAAAGGAGPGPGSSGGGVGGGSRQAARHVSFAAAAAAAPGSSARISRLPPGAGSSSVRLRGGGGGGPGRPSASGGGGGGSSMVSKLERLAKRQRAG